MTNASSSNRVGAGGIRAVFMRGGTSKGLIFHREDLPARREDWDGLFLALMGSPDPYGRQLNGMGGGVSSVSKVCVVGPPSVPGADVDYTFGQVMVNEARVDYGGNCGNMSSAIGPFAVDEGLIAADGGEVRVRIHNTNTGKIIHAFFPVDNGRARVAGDLRIPGIADPGAPIRLEFLDPGGASTGRLLPTGEAAQWLDVPGTGRVRVSMVDAANACVFVNPEVLGLGGIEMPADLSARPDVLQVLERIRVQASLAMGIAATPDEARARRMIPFVGMVSPAQDARTLSGDCIPAGDVDLTVRMISSGQPHQALQLTASLCIAVAARIEGTLVHEAARPTQGDVLRIGMPSGILTVGAEVRRADDHWVAERGYFFRTARRLFDGRVYPMPVTPARS
ncbi:2-methylaconitate cis-trans isomerase PrpF family protein [Castellaniella sp. S9]|uniref:2-methylaconitate cis-trans isomerase PrpF family protein n=1 Tax=Castellaniella sp. S9 TaxID=2993652 RepID=UPI0022B4371F|nr:PrpF domain-containing protein [Castellaniella sp. S9]